ncbi:protease [Propionigenium maris DSM 9537]|uniref:Protease n=1 Tax=Propionigenium maris DSM 9537 TaxID=1123000 RepID=A0A9W6GKL3_9FUSO|nr:U32 family peptidase [Propionigenium maris]GLI55885.1 protease [Propionigenium maris DSM 9537]
MKRAELLAPAGNMEKMKMAFHYGADAVYLGGKVFNLRAGSHNFTEEELREAVRYAHDRDKTVWVTLNIIPHDHETAGLAEYVKFLDEIGVDGVIVADLGVFQIVQENSNLAISVSTQSSNTNWRSVKMWHEMGAKRVVLARENTLENIALIREKVPGIEIEVFIHGAMCMSVSGRCLLSNYMTARDANRGDCAQSCRWKYSIVEGGKDNEGDYKEVLDGDEPTHIFSSKDLCTIEIIDKILDLGVDSLKIEGRMKGIYYVSNVVRSYREALDSYYSGSYKYDEKWLRELETISHRKYTTGFYFGQPDSDAQNYNNRNSYSQSHQLVAKVVEKVDENTYILAVRNRIFSGEELEVISNTGEPKIITLPTMTQIKGNFEEEVEVSHPNTTVRITLNTDISELDMVRRVLPEEKE